MWFYSVFVIILAAYNVALSVVILKLIPLCLPQIPEDKRLPILKKIAKQLKGKGKRGRPKKNEASPTEYQEPQLDADGKPIESY